MQYQILKTNITRTIWQTVRRITKEILGVKGLKISFCQKFLWSLQKHQNSFETPFSKCIPFCHFVLKSLRVGISPEEMELGASPFTVKNLQMKIFH